MTKRRPRPCSSGVGEVLAKAKVQNILHGVDVAEHWNGVPVQFLIEQQPRVRRLTFRLRQRARKRKTAPFNQPGAGSQQGRLRGAVKIEAARIFSRLGAQGEYSHRRRLFGVLELQLIAIDRQVGFRDEPKTSVSRVQ